MTQGNWPPVPLPNQLIAGRYRKGRSLGAGGFGEVFYAEDTKFNPPRAVAIKFIHPHLLTDSQVIEEINNEANILARFKHRNILRVIDFEIDKNQAFIVTELAEGGSLAHRIKPDASQPPQPMPRQEVLFYLERIATALDEAHKQNVIHRDIKPANILLDIDGEPLLSDFGFAMSLANSITVETLTSVYGTPQYVAPEVWNDQASKSSDIYALGVMLYEMVTGYTPFIGTVDELKEMHLSSSVPTLEDRYPRLKYPHELDSVISKALSKKLNKRYNKATDLYKAFKEVLDKQDVIPQKSVVQKPKTTRSYTSNPFYPELEDIDFGEIDIPKPKLPSKVQQKETLLEEIAKNKNDKNWNKVIEAGEKLLVLLPTNRATKVTLADAYFHFGKLFTYRSIWHEAIHNFELAIKYDAKNGEYYTELAKCFFELKDYHSATIYFNKAIEYNPDSSTNYAYLGKCEYQINIDKPTNIANFDLAIDSFNKSITLASYLNSPSLEQYHALLAKSLLKRAKGNDKQVAISHLDAAIKLSPKIAEYYAWRGSARYNPEERINDYTIAIELDPSNSSYLEQRAICYFYIKEYFKAVSDYNQSFKLGNVDNFSRFKRGEAFYHLTYYDRAITDFDIVINSSYKNWYHLYLRGNCYYEKQNYKLAIKDFLDAIKLNECNYTDCYIGISKCYYQLQNYEESLTQLENAFQIKPFEKEIYFWRGMVYKGLKNKKQARFNFDRAINMGHLEATKEKKSLGWF